MKPKVLAFWDEDMLVFQPDYELISQRLDGLLKISQHFIQSSDDGHFRFLGSSELFKVVSKLCADMKKHSWGMKKKEACVFFCVFSYRKESPLTLDDAYTHIPKKGN